MPKVDIICISCFNKIGKYEGKGRVHAVCLECYDPLSMDKTNELSE